MNSLFTLARNPSRRRKRRGSDEHDMAAEIEEALNDRRFRNLPDWLEERFQDDTAEDQMRALFRAALAASLVYLAQLIPEWTLTADAFAYAAALHFGFITPALLLIAAFAKSGTTPLRRDLMSLTIPLLIGGQAVAVYLSSTSPSAVAYLNEFPIIAILCNASLPMSARASLWSTALCLAMVAACARFTQTVVSQVELGSVLPISICALLTLLAAFQRNREARRSFLLQQRQSQRMAEVGAQARHDPLTGLANRRRLEETAARLWAKEATLVSPVCIVLYDVDRFKAYNDMYGHQAGDECLRKVATSALGEIGGEDDVAARYGGEEFMLLLPCTPLEDAVRVAERVRAAVAAQRVPHAGSEMGVVTASFGVACANSGRMTFAQLTAAADAALYRAKHAGRNRVVAAEPEAPESSAEAA